MSRCYIIALTGLTAAALVVLSSPLLAHEGHGKGEVAPYDLDTPRQVSPETAAHIGLETAEVDFGRVEEVLRLTGVVRPVPDQVQAVTSRIAGTILKLTVQVGDTVRRGDLVAEIESPRLVQYFYEARKLDAEYFDLLGEVAGARSRVDELLVQVEAASQHASIVDAEYARLQSNNGAIAVNVLSEKQAEAIRARSEARLREIELSLAGERLGAMNKQAEAVHQSREALREVIASIRDEPGREAARHVASTDAANLMFTEADDQSSGRLGIVRLSAPISGVVIAREAKAGEGVEAGQTLVVVADYTRVQIAGELPESLVERLSPAANNRVRIRRVTGATDELIGVGHVRFISPVIDPIKRTTHLIILAANDQGLLRDGLYVDLSIVLREEAAAIVVPVSAVVTDGPMHFVFVRDGEFYKKQDINPGVSDDRVVEVLDGVFPGDVVVTRGAYSLTQLRPKAPLAASPEGGQDSATGGDTSDDDGDSD